MTSDRRMNQPLIPFNNARPLHLHDGLGQGPISEDEDGSMSYVPGMIGFNPSSPIIFHPPNLPGMKNPPSNDPQDPKGLKRPPSLDFSISVTFNAKFISNLIKALNLNPQLKEALSEFLLPIGTLRFASGTTLLETWNGTAWETVIFPTSDPGGGQIWISPT